MTRRKNFGKYYANKSVSGQDHITTASSGSLTAPAEAERSLDKVIMRSFLLTPIPIVVSFILFLLFSLPKISRTIWAKIGRVLSILLFLSSIVAWFSPLNVMVDAGRQGYHGVLVSRVTKHVEQLLNDGKYSEAKGLLEQFNKDYPIISKHLDELELFVDKLLTKEPANKALKEDAANNRRAP